MSSNSVYSCSWRGFAASNEIAAGRASKHDVDDLAQRHVVVVRAFVVAPAEVHPHLLGRDVAGRVVDRLDVQLRAAAELREGLVGVHVPRHREVGAIELEHDPGRVDLVVLGLHHVRQRGDVLLVAGVVLIGEEDRDHARRGGGHEHILDVGPGDRRLEVGDVGAHRVEVAIRDGPGARGQREVERAHHPRHVVRKLAQVGRQRVHAGLAPETVEPLLDIGRVADLALLTVVDDRHAGARLALDHVDDGLADLFVEVSAVALAAIAGLERLEQRGRSRQAAGVGGEDRVGR